MALKRTINKNKYNRKVYTSLNVRVKSDGSDGFSLDELRACAEAAGESLNAFVLQALRERMEQLR